MMAKGFGIAALVIVIVAFFVPIFGILVSGLAILFAVAAALAGDRAFATATPIIAGINTFFLSPSTWAMMGGQTDAERTTFVLVLLLGIAAPFVAIALNAAGVLGAKVRP
jgi:hypothetical protein